MTISPRWRVRNSSTATAARLTCSRSASARRGSSAPSRNIAHARFRPGWRRVRARARPSSPSAIDIGAMHHGVDRERDFQAHHLGRKRPLAREGAVIAGDMVGAFRLAVLDRNLHVVEAGVGELAQGRRGDADRRGDEIGVEAGAMRRRRQSRRGRAARRARRRKDGPAARRARRLRRTPAPRFAVSSSVVSRGSSASGLEQYGQPSGQRCVSSARRPSGLCRIASDEATGGLSLAVILAQAAAASWKDYHNSSSFFSASPRNSVLTSVRMRSRGAE